VAKACAAAFEARLRPEIRPSHVGLIRTLWDEIGGVVAHRQHLLRIVLPIRGEAQRAAGAQFRSEAGNERSIDQATFVMTLFVPGIREEHQNLIEAAVANLIPQHLDGIVADDAQVA